mmetsp:Transcript_21248/g.37784  ORF Transcript_21248/g.37784 Transcript_21248/m.37784 type:complete len:280 (+) Transcript_21248:334-1173(+)
MCAAVAAASVASFVVFPSFTATGTAAVAEKSEKSFSSSCFPSCSSPIDPPMWTFAASVVVPTASSSSSEPLQFSVLTFTSSPKPVSVRPCSGSTSSRADIKMSISSSSSLLSFILSSASFAVDRSRACVIIPSCCLSFRLCSHALSLFASSLSLASRPATFLTCLIRNTKPFHASCSANDSRSCSPEDSSTALAEQPNLSASISSSPAWHTLVSTRLIAILAASRCELPVPALPLNFCLSHTLRSQMHPDALAAFSLRSARIRASFSWRTSSCEWRAST